MLAPKDWLRLTLTGEKATDMSDAAGSWWLDEAARDLVGARRSPPARRAPRLAPPLLEGSQPAGRLRPRAAEALGLPRDVVVAAGGGDAAVGAVGLGAVRPGDAFISLGTACQWIVASDAYRAAPEKLVHSFAHALPGRWYRMAAMLNGAGALAFAGRLLGAEVAALEAEAAADYRGPGDLLFLPYLSGERTPHDDPHARGVAFGLDRGELARRFRARRRWRASPSRWPTRATAWRRRATRRAGRPDRRRRAQPAVDAHDRLRLRASR